jgi:glycosyltransferase involved in cell wall biosynthesis
MTRAPRVVALVPAWNASAFIRRTLDALAAQTYPHFEILVSVDLSSDDTARICQDYSRTDPRVRVLVQTERLGFVGNTRALLEAAEGEYLSWAWHDDILLPGYVQRLVPILEGNPQVVCAFTDVELHRLNGERETLVYTALEGLADPVERAKRVLWISENWWLPNRGIFRASAARRVGGFKSHWAGEYKADWPWALHMALLGEHVRVPEVLCRKYIKITSLSASWRRNRRTNAAVAWSCGREIRQSDLPRAAKVRLHLTLASVAAAFMRQRYVERQEFHRVHAYHRAARDAERALQFDRKDPS